MEISPKDETKVIIALGIEASILLYLQQKVTVGGLFSLIATTYKPAAEVVSFINYVLYAELILTSIYILLLAVAFGADTFNANSRLADGSKGVADIYFGFVSIGLVVLAVSVFVFLEADSISSPSTSTPYDAYLFAVLISVSAMIAAVVFSYKVRHPTPKGTTR